MRLLAGRDLAQRAQVVVGAVGGELVSWGYRGPMLEATPGDPKLRAGHDLTYALLAYLAAGRLVAVLRFG